MKILVTGAKGQLGFDVVKQLRKFAFTNVLATDRLTLDITNKEAVFTVVNDYKPDVIIHCAAWTAVDLAEDNKDLVYDVNVNGTDYLARASREVDAKMIYISTDYVFDGKSNKPYNTTDKPNPLSYYGETKYLGELAVMRNLKKYFILRVSWVFGVNGNNFIKTMLTLGRKKQEINVVCDRIGSPSYTIDIANLLCEMLESDKYGIYHASNEGIISWFDFAKEIFKQAKYPVVVNPINSSEYQSKAIRPKNSAMSKNSLIASGFKRFPKWEDALSRYLIELEVKS